jgi:hypothetical protein
MMTCDTFYLLYIESPLSWPTMEDGPTTNSWAVAIADKCYLMRVRSLDLVNILQGSIIILLTDSPLSNRGASYLTSSNPR